jgi:uncharacterized protein
VRQIIAIHGGTTFRQYDDYLASLSDKTVYVERLRHQPMWKELLQGELGNEYDVLLPSMPNKTNAKYAEWKLWFERIAEIAEDDVILVGHSLGAIFLAKYLSEEAFPKRIRATFLVAAPYGDESTEDLGDFKIETISDRFKEQAGEVVFYFGEDDPVIAIGEMHRYQQAIPDAEYNVHPAPDHFARIAFPEIVERIRSLS